MTPSQKACALREAIPTDGLFAEKTWRIAPDPLPLTDKLFAQIEALGPRLLAFQSACNRLYLQSVEGKQPSWIHRDLDAGKSEATVAMAREKAWKNDLPAVIRPDILLTENGLAITELDSVPGGIGLTAWLQEAYAGVNASRATSHESRPEQNEGRTQNSKWPSTTHASRLTSHASRPEMSPTTTMREGFASVLHSALHAPRSEILHTAIVISEEARDYRPEMKWIVERLRHATRDTRHAVCAPEDLEYRPEGVFLGGQRVGQIYRFFELFDLPNIAGVDALLDAARAGRVRVTPPFKPQLEEKLWFALFWFPQLADFWRRELGDRYARDLREVIPFTWLMDPAPLPPHAVIPRLDIHDWEQLGHFSQKQRELVLKISGFSERAWGSRGVCIGSDMPQEEWRRVVTQALAEFDSHPHILQRFEKTRLVEHAWWDFEREALVPMKGRLRLCPYYFVDGGKPHLGGILATLCPADKKIIHGMRDAILTLAVPGA